MVSNLLQADGIADFWAAAIKAGIHIDLVRIASLINRSRTAGADLALLFRCDQ